MPLENKTRKMRRDELPVVVVVECSVWIFEAAHPPPTASEENAAKS
jgi:hypothetical protein